MQNFDWALYNVDGLVAANFVVTSDGRWVDEAGSSRGISNDLDRQVLVHLRHGVGAILVGGNTARKEGYRPNDRFETYVATRGASTIADGLKPINATSDADMRKQVAQIATRHNGLLVEAGPTLLKTLADSESIQRIFLTVIGEAEDFENSMAKHLNIKGFKLIKAQSVSMTHFLVYSRS